MKQITLFLFVLFMGFTSKIVKGQDSAILEENILSFEEYLGYVKKHHPLMKQANLILKEGEANLLKSRGGFDPKIELDYSRKNFKGLEYYDQLNTTFKIPTWYGLEFKANYENNSGVFLDPSLDVPEGGLYSFGVSGSLAQGLLINERMASLKKARFFTEQKKASRDLLVNDLLYDASLAYFEWVKADNERRIYQDFLENARMRLTAIERSVAVGEKAAIDITEARIIYQNRQLNLEAATLKKRKAALVASNYLWLDDVPLEIQEYVNPLLPEITVVTNSLQLEGITNIDALMQSHPKMQSLNAKIDELEVDRDLKRNKLLPKLDVEFNYINEDVNEFSGYNNDEFKTFVNFSFPILLRKERGDLQLAKLKINDLNFERTAASLSLQNKIDASQAEIASLEKQSALILTIVKDYIALVTAEERKFSLGESSLFLINSREQKLIDAQLKENEILAKNLGATANLYNALGITEPSINN